jgi:hypothetical protein
LRRTARDHIVDAHHFPDETAHGRRLGRKRLPFGQRTAFVGLEVAEADPSDCGGIDQCSHGFTHDRKQRLHAGVIEHRLFVAHEELIELQIYLGSERRDTKHIRSDFVDLSHQFFLRTPFTQCRTLSRFAN